MSAPAAFSLICIADDIDSLMVQIANTATVVTQALELLDNVSDNDTRLSARPLTGLKWGEQVSGLLNIVEDRLEVHAAVCDGACDRLREYHQQHGREGRP